jgi:UDP-2,3-diacylglucosamine pyrophosphatase LpxH
MVDPSHNYNPNLHSFIVSDLHLADAELGQAGRSLWKRYKRPKFFIDRSFKNWINRIMTEVGDDPAELILDGDIFDFDSVMRVPLYPAFPVSKLEIERGLFPEEDKSRYKIEVILGDHTAWVQSVRDWLRRGHSLVFVIGNHDIELQWPAVQKEILSHLQLLPEQEHLVRFCEWFYISNSDTTIEHGNQHDSYCVAVNPIHPLIKKGKRIQVRLPFGNITSRYMVNGMGLFNPHVESSFLMTLPEYLRFFFRYAVRVQPLLPFTWMWSSAVSFWISMGDGLLPAMRDPLFTEQRVEEIARKANSTPQAVRTLRELHVHPAIFNPIKIARELWLDRFIMMLFLLFVSFELFIFINAFVSISLIWSVVCFAMMCPVLFYYSRDIQSEVIQAQDEAIHQAPITAKITNTQRLVFGHTHREMHVETGNIEVINVGTWSPAFRDPECKVTFGKKCFAWIRPDPEGKKPTRVAELYEWKDPDFERITKKRDASA